MIDHEEFYTQPDTATNVQFHEIKPSTDNGMSFGALLEKFYLNSDAVKKNGEVQSKLDEVSKAQDLVGTSKVKKA